MGYSIHHDWISNNSPVNTQNIHTNMYNQNITDSSENVPFWCRMRKILIFFVFFPWLCKSYQVIMINWTLYSCSNWSGKIFLQLKWLGRLKICGEVVRRFDSWGQSAISHLIFRNLPFYYIQVIFEKFWLLMDFISTSIVSKKMDAK